MGAAISVVNFAIHAVITALIVLATRHAARVLGTAAKATGTAAKATGLAKSTTCVMFNRELGIRRSSRCHLRWSWLCGGQLYSRRRAPGWADCSADESSSLVGAISTDRLPEIRCGNAPTMPRMVLGDEAPIFVTDPR